VDRIKKGRKPKAIVLVHLYGMPAKINELVSVSRKYEIPIVEDAAEALGSTYEGKKAGTFGDIGIYSFNGNKIITTGGGGAVLFRDEVLAAKAKHLATTAKRAHAWEFHHDEVGYNYRMPNLNAALGCAQLKRLPEFLNTKRKLAAEYETFFAQQKEVQFVSARAGTKPNFWLNAVLVRDRANRDQWLKDFNAQGVMMRPVWELMSDLPMYANCTRDGLEVARSLANRLVNMPSGVPV
jgi:dTDP-4-amino-4,6-dideoxygalactose transaminase